MGGTVMRREHRTDWNAPASNCEVPEAELLLPSVIRISNERTGMFSMIVVKILDLKAMLVCKADDIISQRVCVTPAPSDGFDPR
jgi:hypothetical protein